MKARNLFLSLFAFAALCACNKEAQPEVPAVLENDAFVAINICTAGENMTKADPTDGGYVAGSSDEYAVNNAYFLFYKDGAFSQAASHDLEWNDHDDKVGAGANIERFSTAVVVLKGKTIAPNQILVLLNADETLRNSVKGQSLENVKKIVGDYSSTTGGFLMSNSVYYEGGVVCTAPIAAGNIKDSEAEAKADAASVDVYVERVLSKVTVTEDSPMGDKMDTDDKAEVDTDGDGVVEEVTLKHKILGYAVTPQINSSYLVKNIAGINDDTKYWTGWNEANNFRSYWAVNPTTPTPTFDFCSFNEADANDTKPFYPQENVDQSTGNNPKLLVVAQIQDELGNGYTAFKYMGKHYTELGFKELALNKLQSAGVKKTVGGSLTDLEAADLEHYSAYDVDPTTYNPYDAALKLTDAVKANMDDDAETAADAALEELGTAQCWNNGYCYFFVNINHFGKYDGAFLSGLVRNHQYNITVNSISGWGTPVYDPTDDIIPETPVDDEYSYVAATINILKWKVVNQSVDLQ